MSSIMYRCEQDEARAGLVLARCCKAMRYQCYEGMLYLAPPGIQSQ
ncbi:hypothetical protein E2C01_057055 [Portunus trituberculatus]|uniref:Uncharacterized protein n=1 Tax=Portunus trituberculatus TaxID=210409 RepID=A0A5B7GZ05_PORTR|nr:hypothetical protein [Portunus trituberculatus]